mmetsp:Transcript_12761/g.27018  ORF Transcript_12761/g.27018 Transcript_12761/m.27018 type:complete len:318 (-) Transcript_12761:196-1149(-)
MIVRTALLLSLLGSAAAAPAIVWQRGQTSSSPVHHSDSVGAAELLASALSGGSDENNERRQQSVVFFLGREQGGDGNEMLTHLASSGALPRTKDKYGSAHRIHHHVDGMESAQTVVRDAAAMAPPSASSSGRGQSGSVITVTLSEFFSKIQGSPESAQQNAQNAKEADRRTRDLGAASVLVVAVPASTNPSDIDDAVVTAVEADTVSSVVLTAQRSIDEVKRERSNLVSGRQARNSKLADAPRRRLEDQQDGGDNGNNNNQDGENVAYVNMTPNILAGILYTIMFIVVTQIGIGCMGMIQGQGDIYVKKMPTIGREA